MIMKDLKDRKVSISFRKAIIRLCNKIDVKHGFVQTEKDIISMESVISVTETEDKQCYRIIYNGYAIMTGTITNVDDKFLTMSIYDNNNDFIYDKMIAIKTIHGIKVYNENK